MEMELDHMLLLRARPCVTLSFFSELRLTESDPEFITEATGARFQRDCLLVCIFMVFLFLY
jgi:hypothetical protein